jgi:transcriptional regulator with XRE-family HTH domain
MTDWIGVEDCELTEESATAILKDWLAFARYVARSHTNLPEKAGITRSRLAKLNSVSHKETPTPEELAKLSAASGYPAHDLAVRASAFLHSQTGLESLASELTGEYEISSCQELKNWLKSARTRGRSGRLTQAQLAARIGRSVMSVNAWENPNLDRFPQVDDIRAIAIACGVPAPILKCDVRSSTNQDPDPEPDWLSFSTVDEEILCTGRLLSRRAHASTHRERNAQVFRARYGGQGDDESTLQSIGDAHGITRERVRQIVDKQLSFVPVTTLSARCFDALAAACLELESMTVSLAEERLRDLLGRNLSLRGASNYGREVLGRPLPIQLIPISDGSTLVMASALPPWFQSAIKQAKAIIRHCGAAQFNLVWAMTMRQHQSWVDPDQFRKIIVHAPGFEWIDDQSSWFWFGSDGSANRLIKRAAEILACARRPLDVEIIYGGITRHTRAPNSDVSAAAGVWPPMEVVRDLLEKSPAFVCQQGDDFRLSEEHVSIEKQRVADLILAELERRGGLASRSELHKSLVIDKGMNLISFSVALAHSPLLRQLDRSVFAIRGWPISAARLTEAQHRVGNTAGPLINFKEVDVNSEGDVSWMNVVSNSSMSNMYAGVPSKARLHLPDGQYLSNETVLTLVDQRMVGLTRLVLASGGKAGTIYRTTANARSRSVRVEVVGHEDAADEESE